MSNLSCGGDAVPDGDALEGWWTSIGATGEELFETSPDILRDLNRGELDEIGSNCIFSGTGRILDEDDGDVLSHVNGQHNLHILHSLNLPILGAELARDTLEAGHDNVVLMAEISLEAGQLGVDDRLARNLN